MGNLIRILKAHGFNAYSKDGQLWAEAQYCKDGESFTEWEEIEATVQDVYFWLGY